MKVRELVKELLKHGLNDSVVTSVSTNCKYSLHVIHEVKKVKNENLIIIGFN